MSTKKISIKNSLLVYTFFAVSSLFAGCEKYAGHGIIEFTVTSAGQPVTNAVIHVKAGTLTPPDIPVDQYDAHIHADAVGEYWYNNVQPGNYFFYATGKINGAPVAGSSNLQVKEIYRHNTYEVALILE